MTRSTPPSGTIRLPTPLLERLAAAAQERNLAPAWVAARLLEEGLDRLVPADEFSLTRKPT